MQQVESLPFGAFANDGSVRVERAAAELRAGRPVIVSAGDERHAVLALDTATPPLYDAFARATGDTHQLYLTPPRAAVTGLDAPDGALLALAGVDHATASAWAYLHHGLVRQAWTPGTVAARTGARLARLALLLPAIVIADVSDARAQAVFAGCLDVSEADLDTAYATAARDFTLMTRTRVPLRDAGDAQFVMFRGGLAQRDQLAIIVGEPDFSGVVPVRVHSSCITGDLFGSLKCDCGDQLRFGLAQLDAMGGGVLLYLDQEGRGTGLASKMRAYGHQDEGMDTVDADAHLGFGADERRYEAAVAMLEGLGIRRVNLLTNNPAKIAWLRASGIDVVERTGVIGTVTPENVRYLETKARRARHMLDVDALRASLTAAE